MTAINFPDDPTTGQEFTSGSRTWIWDGSVWNSKETSAIELPDVQANYVLTLMSAI